MKDLTLEEANFWSQIFAWTKENKIATYQRREKNTYPILEGTGNGWKHRLFMTVNAVKLVIECYVVGYNWEISQSIIHTSIQQLGKYINGGRLERLGGYENKTAKEIIEILNNLNGGKKNVHNRIQI